MTKPNVPTVSVPMPIEKPKLRENGRLFFECFPCVCPEPVLAKRSFLCLNGSKRPFSYLLPGSGGNVEYFWELSSYLNEHAFVDSASSPYRVTFSKRQKVAACPC